jgi:hypothetical protein
MSPHPQRVYQQNLSIPDGGRQAATDSIAASQRALAKSVSATANGSAEAGAAVSRISAARRQYRYTTADRVVFLSPSPMRFRRAGTYGSSKVIFIDGSNQVRKLVAALAVLVVALLGTPAPASAADDFTTLVNQRSGLCLDQDYTGGTPHSTPLAWRCLNNSNQQWNLKLISTNSNPGVYRIINKRSGQCLDQDFTGGTPHSRVLVWTCNGNGNQHWELVLNNGGYRLRNILSGKCLDQDYTGGVARSKVLAWTCNDQANQRW